MEQPLRMDTPLLPCAPSGHSLVQYSQERLSHEGGDRLAPSQQPSRDLTGLFRLEKNPELESLECDS